jgi:hypothetical protein
MLIALGALLTSYSETVKTKQNPPAQSPALAAPRADAR